ncbi:MAG: RelA/SpoT domain-containing protein [Candidatus Micrarchaeota archaeon]|nr:RelA/SpoT domain-containing protein [Candidatus Micrarchaeota archaeon]
MPNGDPTYSRGQINKAGRILSSSGYPEEAAPGYPEEKITWALKVLDYWRALHSYPMQVFYMRLKTVAKKIDKHALTSQRLKRVYSILAKLRRPYHGRKPTMELYQMQDIGGCRAVLSNVKLAKKLARDYYIKGELKHKLVGRKDYIDQPKEDGYRGIHLIYKYNSDKENKKKYNGMLVEVQIRSKLQHLWATAVETTGLFTRYALKSSEGSPEWLEFFKLVSSAFARIEKYPIVPDTPRNERELYLKIAHMEQSLKVIDKMRGWSHALRIFREQTTKKGEVRFFLLELDIDSKKLTIRTYTKKEEQKALDEYAVLENKYRGRKEYDVVLVGVAAAHDLENAYPNYYADTNEFLEHLTKITRKYN